MQPKAYQTTASTHLSYTPLTQTKRSYEYVTPKAFTFQQQSLNISSTKAAFETFRKDLWEEGLVRGMTQVQKQTLNKKIDNLSKRISSSMQNAIRQSAQQPARSIDYDDLIISKQNQVVALQKKISILQNQLSANSVSKQDKDLRQKVLKLSNQIKNQQLILKNKNQFIVSQFSNFIEVKQTLLRLKSTFDKTQNKGDLVRLFQGVKLPQIQQYSFDNLTKNNNQVSRTNIRGQNKIQSQIQILLARLQRSIIKTQRDLESTLTSFILELDRSLLKEKLLENQKLTNENSLLMTRFNAAAGIWTNQIKDLKRQFPTARIDIDNGITKLLQDSKVNISLVNNVVQLQPNPIVQVPMQDSKTSQLLLAVCKDIKKIISKYPKIQGQISQTVIQLLNQGVLDFMEVGNDPNRIIEIVRYLPQQVRVDNVYSFNGDKDKRLQFHLRVLIKALLQELDRLKTKTGQVLQLDQSIIKMIQQQILEVVNVDDILKVFKVNTKIVQVQKIIEKVVEKIVQVPQIIPVEKIVEKIIEVPKIQQIQKVVNVPVQVIKVVDNVIEKIVQVQKIVEIVKQIPRVVQKIVEKIIQIPKIIQVQKIVQKIIVETQVLEVEKIVNNVVYQVKQVPVIEQKIVTVDKIVQKLVQVPVYTQKIVQKIIHVPQIVQIEKIVEKVVKDTEIRVVKQNNVQVEVAIEIVDRLVQKIVVVDNYIQKLVQVPKIIQKIVPVKNTTTEVIEVQVIRQKLVPHYEVKYIDKVINIVQPLIKQVQKIVELKVQVPFYEQKLVTVPQIITRIQIQRIQIPKIIEIEKVVEKVVIKNNIVEVQKPVVHYVTQYQIVKNNIEKIIPAIKTVQKIKEVKVNVDKIIEKMVEIPKVVEVEKIIQKVVVIPRIIEKVIEVPQIVETTIEKIVEVQKILEVQKIVEIPIYQEKIVEVQVIKNVYIQVEKVVDRVVEKIVPFQTVVEKIVEVPNEIERIVPLKRQVPKPVEVHKHISNIIQVQKVIQVVKPVTIAVEVPVQVEKIVQKVVVVENNFEKIVQVPQLIERIVQIHTQVVEVQQVERIVERIIPKNVIQTVTQDNVVVQNKAQAIPTIVQKLVPVTQIVKQIVEVQKIVQKVVERIVQVPKIVEIQKIVEKVIKVPQYIQLQKIVPQLIKVNNIVETIIEKVVSVPVIQQVVKSIPTEVEKVVQVKQTQNTIQQVQVFRDKIIEVPKVIHVDHVNNIIEKQLEIVERFEQVSIPIYSTIQKIIQVPQVLEKIVQKIVMMPQVVQVIKNIHHLPDAVGLGPAIPEQASQKQEQYRKLANNLRKSTDQLATELRKLKPQHPNLKVSIDAIEKMFVDLQKAVTFSRVVSVPTQIIVQKQVSKPVVITPSVRNNQTNLALSLLTQKLIMQLQRIKKQRSDIKLELDEDVLLTFFVQFANSGQTTTLQFEKQLRSYTESVLNKYRKLGGWKTDHQMMLLNTLQEKFTNTQLLKNMNTEMKKLRADLSTANLALKPLKQASTQIADKFKRLQDSLTKLFQNLQKEKNNSILQTQRYFVDFTNFIKQNFETYKSQPFVRTLTSEKEFQSVQVDRLNSKLRESFGQLQSLKSKFMKTTLSTSRIINSQQDSHNKSFQQQSSPNVSLFNERQLKLQYQAKLRDQAASYEKQLFELKSLKGKDSVIQDQTSTGRSPQRSTNLTDRSRLDSSRLVSSNYRVLTSPSSVARYPTNIQQPRNLYSSMMQRPNK